MYLDRQVEIDTGWHDLSFAAVLVMKFYCFITDGSSFLSSAENLKSQFVFFTLLIGIQYIGYWGR